MRAVLVDRQKLTWSQLGCWDLFKGGVVVADLAFFVVDVVAAASSALRFGAIKV
jgi:hypothetical protein